MNDQFDGFSENVNKLITNLEKVIIGKRDVIEIVIMSLLCKGHILIEDVPGVGKTVLAKGIAKSLGLKFSRIQFTPDMLPSDVTGVSIYNQKNLKFEYRPGPIVANIVLADEINRATPKTQSALLEAMEEKQLTVDGKTYIIPEPFNVVATQNPIEYEGTFPLPEAQLDRFLIKISIGYPKIDDEINMIEAQKNNHPINSLMPIITYEELLQMQRKVKEIFVSKAVKKYIIDIVNATRNHNEIYLGSSPRGSLGLYNCAKAFAAINKRDYVLPDDVKRIIKYVLSHRIIMNPSARMKEIKPQYLLKEIVSKLPVPGGVFVSE